LLPVPPNDGRLVHKYRVYSRGAATTTEPIRSRNRDHFLRRLRTASATTARRRTFHQIRFWSVVLCLGAYFICRHQGGSHAEWPKDSHEHAPTQTCGVIFCPPKAVDTECRPNPVERASKRPKKLRAISGASPGGSQVRECRRRGELLPTRRALLQIDVFEPRGDIDRDVPSRLTFAADALSCCPSPTRRENRAAQALMPPLRLMN
jgi:hypothetical protein